MNAPAWRSLLFVPVVSERFVAKAHTRGADAIILDLEDSIAPGEKAAARAALPSAAKTITQAGTDVTVRINRPVELAVPDIAAAVCEEVKALMVPKVMGAEHVELLSEVVATQELVKGLPIGHTRFIAVVETAKALSNLVAIAQANPRVMALGLGSEDLCTELDAQPGGDSLYPFSMQVVAAARGAGIAPFGAVGQFADFSDPDGYRAGLRRSRGLGFSMTACIHPSQVPIIN
ncbi:MAG: CoA ester lyase, partial [Chromatiales bacterium]|nr:CoA ester lyase [Chromatiales bacterium]